MDTSGQELFVSRVLLQLSLFIIGFDSRTKPVYYGRISYTGMFTLSPEEGAKQEPSYRMEPKKSTGTLTSTYKESVNAHAES